MKILLLEYITGGGLAGSDLPLSLAREGGLMAASLASDLLALPDVHLAIPWDVRLPQPDYSGHERANFFPMAAEQSFLRHWREALNECDSVWPIAPETGGVLEALCHSVETSGLRLLNCSSAAVALAASKRATAKRLSAHGVETALTYALESAPPDFPWPRVVKPDDGVGCDGVYRIDDPAHWERFYAGMAAGSMLVQPYIDGPSLSLSALFWRGEAVLLSINRQSIELSENGAFRLKGCEVSAVSDEDGEYAALAGRIAKAVPELAGYAGVDFIHSVDGPVVLEINPRLTSSYAALGQALGVNPAALVLDLFENGRLPIGLQAAGRPVSVAW